MKYPERKKVRFIEDCKKCGQKMERRAHDKLTNKVKKQPYYYAEWDYCNPKTGGCGHLQHYEKFKKLNPLGQLYEEQDRRYQHLRSIV